MERLTTSRDPCTATNRHKVTHQSRLRQHFKDFNISTTNTLVFRIFTHHISFSQIKTKSSNMGLPQQTNTPVEKPSTSETNINADYPSDSTPAANITTQSSSVGATNTSDLARGAVGGTHGDAEQAAEKLYEERMEVSAFTSRI